MNTRRRGFLSKAIASAFALSVICIPAARADAAEPLRLIVGFPAGGALDTLARAMAEQLRLAGEDSVLVENKPGASSRLAIEYVKRAPANGRTVLLSSTAPFILFPMTYRHPLGYDLQHDFIPVAQLVEVPTVVSTGMDRPYKTIQEYAKWVRTHPADASVGLTNLGGTLHFATLGMARSIGVPLQPVAYKGGSPLATDLAGGHVPLATDALASELELHRAGRLRILGVSGTHRNAALPDVPTLHESGIDAFDHANATYSAFVPAGTPPQVVKRLEQALIAAVQKPDVKLLLTRAGLEVTGMPAAQLSRELDEERQYWKPLVEASGFHSEE
jgi:tripartite-type tricarboxylate transporter receptor subunit TctC